MFYHIRSINRRLLKALKKYEKEIERCKEICLEYYVDVKVRKFEVEYEADTGVYTIYYSMCEDNFVLRFTHVEDVIFLRENYVVGMSHRQIDTLVTRIRGRLAIWNYDTDEMILDVDPSCHTWEIPEYSEEILAEKALLLEEIAKFGRWVAASQ